MKVFRPLLYILPLLWGVMATAQNNADSEQELSLDKGNIETQFEFVSKKSGNYNANGKRYEVVRAIHLDKLKGNVLDSLKGFRATITELNKTIDSQKETVTNLNSKLEDTTGQLAEVTAEKDSMSFFGAQMSKGGYNVLMWSVIIGLLVLFLLFVFKFKRSNVLTQEAKTALGELESEYEDHRRRALEREQKISRKLQDEINRQKK